MAPRRQPRRIGTPFNSLSHIDAHEEALIFSHPSHPIDMSFQLNESKDGAVYTSKGDTLSESNESQTEQLMMDSHYLPQQDDLKSMNHIKNEGLTQRDIGMWVKSWKLDHAYASTHIRAMPGAQGSHENHYQSATDSSASWPQFRTSPTTATRKQPSQAPFCENLQSASTSGDTQTSPDGGSVCPPLDWHMAFGSDAMPHTPPALGELGRGSPVTEPLAPGYLMPAGIAGCMERNETRYYPYYAQDMSYSGIPYLGPQSHSWTDPSCSNVTNIPTQHSSSQWDMNNDSHCTDYGLYCCPGSPFSSALSSAATPGLPLTATNPEPLVTIESNTYLEDPDLESSSERQSRASSSADAEIGSLFALSSGAEEYQTKRRGYRSYSQRNDELDAFLIECKLAGMSYKEIKEKGRFTVAESTLRGRFRSLTKRKELRVRKPDWQDSDLKLLCEAVKRYAEPPSAPITGEELLPQKISWKQVGEYIWKKGGSYHFGNATCKKKWAELQRNHAYVQNASLGRAF